MTACFLWSCAGNKTNVDYDTSVDFSTYKTYALSEKTDEQTNKSRIDTPLVHQRVHESIDAGLTSKGLHSVDLSQADILVTYHLSVAVTGHSGSSLSLGFGSYSQRSSAGVSVGVPLGSHPIEEGTLVIYIVDAKKNSVVWQNAASRQLSRSSTPEKTRAAIDEVVNGILAGYPPKK